MHIRLTFNLNKKASEALNAPLAALNKSLYI